MYEVFYGISIYWCYTETCAKKYNNGDDTMDCKNKNNVNGAFCRCKLSTTCADKYNNGDATMDCKDERNVKVAFCKCKTCEEDPSTNGKYYVGSYGEYCYITQGKRWVDAKEACANITAHLPRIKLINEQTEVESITGV